MRRERSDVSEGDLEMKNVQQIGALANVSGGEKEKVLVIDDSPAARASMVYLLEGAGFPTLTLPSAIGATRTILRSRVGVVVADVSMPGLSGDKLVKVLRGIRRLSYLRIVLVSGMADEQLDEFRRLEGVDAVLPKRLIDAQLVSTIRSLGLGVWDSALK